VPAAIRRVPLGTARNRPASSGTWSSPASAPRAALHRPACSDGTLLTLRCQILRDVCGARIGDVSQLQHAVRNTLHQP